jgi:hypothetical protein
MDVFARVGGELRLFQDWVEASSSVFVLAACAVSASSVLGHLRHNKHAALRNYTVRILLMVPVYGIEAFCALRWVRWGVLLQLVREVYEAVVVFSFVQFMLTYLGGPLELAAHLGANAEANAGAAKAETGHLAPCCCLRPWSGSRFVRRCLVGCLQYVPVQLVCAGATALAWSQDAYHPGWLRATDAWPYIIVAKNISQSWALYCLVLFYRAARRRMEGSRPLAKFLCIKFIVFFTFWQALLVTALQTVKVSGVAALNHRLAAFLSSNPELTQAWRTSRVAREELGATLTNFLLCIEMLGFAFLHAHAYPPDEFTAERLATMCLGGGSGGAAAAGGGEAAATDRSYGSVGASAEAAGGDPQSQRPVSDRETAPLLVACHAGASAPRSSAAVAPEGVGAAAAQAADAGGDARVPQPRLSRAISAPLRVKFVQGINLLDIVDAAREISYVRGVGSPRDAQRGSAAATLRALGGASPRWEEAVAEVASGRTEWQASPHDEWGSALGAIQEGESDSEEQEDGDV